MSECDRVRVGPWRVLKSALVLDNAWARVRKDRCALPNGTVIQDYYYWEGGDFAITFAVTEQEEVLLVRQYRHGPREVVVEIAGRLINTEKESPMEAAQRELLEETRLFPEANGSCCAE